MLEKHLWNSFLLYLVIEILQLEHEISSFSEMLYKIGVLKKFSKFSDKHKKLSEVFCQKMLLKILQNLQKKRLCQSLLFNTVAGWKP